MKRRALISLLPLAAIFIACGEDEDVGHSGPLDAAPEIIDALPPQVDSAPPPLRFDAGPRRDATLEPDAALDAAPDAEPDAAPAPDAAPRPANWVEVTLTPGRPSTLRAMRSKRRRSSMASTARPSPIRRCAGRLSPRAWPPWTPRA
ncbi:hypothetical protein KJ940_19205 [Myxococcota bacterium]|nr:hypothetical protein [Myxococcota bacterium]